MTVKLGLGKALLCVTVAVVGIEVGHHLYKVGHGHHYQKMDRMMQDKPAKAVQVCKNWPDGSYI